MIFSIENERELGDEVYHRIKPKLKGGFVCGLTGNLGAGKTALVKQLARLLGVKTEVTSPTFNLRKEYPLPKTFKRAKILQHIDLYRLENLSKSDLQDFSDWILDDKAITFVEWPERIKGHDRFYNLQVYLKGEGENRRKVELRWL